MERIYSLEINWKAWAEAAPEKRDIYIATNFIPSGGTQTTPESYTAYHYTTKRQRDDDFMKVVRIGAGESRDYNPKDSPAVRQAVLYSGAYNNQ